MEIETPERLERYTAQLEAKTLRIPADGKKEN